MKLTTAHLRFYQAKKTPVPGWIAAIPKTPWSLVEPCAVSVHELINSQIKTPRYTEAHNLMHLIKLVQSHKQETVKELLQRIAEQPTRTDLPRRIGFARTWLRRIGR